MGKTTKFLFGLFYDVFRFLALGVFSIILIILCLFSVQFDMRSYDIVFTSRINSGRYYGIEYGEKFEVWRIDKSDDGSLYTIRLYP